MMMMVMMVMMPHVMMMVMRERELAAGSGGSRLHNRRRGCREGEACCRNRGNNNVPDIHECPLIGSEGQVPSAARIVVKLRAAPLVLKSSVAGVARNWHPSPETPAPNRLEGPRWRNSAMTGAAR
jgi:hypothetical protein